MAAENASQVAPLHAHDVNEYLNYTAFDMFTSFMFGAQLKTASTIVSTDPDIRGKNAENERFVTAALGVFEKTNKMSQYPFEFLLAKFLPNYKTSQFTALQDDWNTVREVGLKKIHGFIER